MRIQKVKSFFVQVLQEIFINSEEQPAAEPMTPATNETDPLEPVHCGCCQKNRKRTKTADFSVQFQTKMADKGMQIFPEKQHNESGFAIGIEDNNTEDETEDDTDNDTESDTEDDTDNDTESNTEKEAEDEDDDVNNDTEDDPNDPDYDPSEDIDVEPEVYNEGNVDYVQGDLYKGRKFLVYEDQLLAAFWNCPMCSAQTDSTVCSVRSTFCRMRQLCSSLDFKRVWDPPQLEMFCFRQLSCFPDHVLQNHCDF
ncbi:serine-aspartate repeat-containing protein C-like isoform X2 [Anneissia japonica]|uniref:serine-aspartate repeat-containing protein C-like isoform X2 n=2 Tax=Anneissia japonica TaxID=1529436 RepID=UPI001425AF94|nr:serine-aspartate repeat-containing protein C-like isoform X2 [Anneissia japonica]